MAPCEDCQSRRLPRTWKTDPTHDVSPCCGHLARREANNTGRETRRLDGASVAGIRFTFVERTDAVGYLSVPPSALMRHTRAL